MIAPTAATIAWARRLPSRWVWACVVLALGATACGDDASTATSPTTPSTPTSESWSSVVAPGGTSSRSFTVTTAGTISVTMLTAGQTVGLGVGVPRVNGGGCRLGVTATTSGGASPQISAPADAGQYCVQVFDLGTLTDAVGFALKIDHP